MKVVNFGVKSTALSMLAAVLFPSMAHVAFASSMHSSSPRRELQEGTEDIILTTQTYFVPFPEDLLFDAFKTISSDANGNLETQIILSIGVDQTVIYYDHWEEDYNSGLVWGDGNATNGCIPEVSPCTDGADILLAGETIRLENEVDPDKRGDSVLFDGADRVQTTYPISMTRAALPKNIGSLFAGAVEALDADYAGGVEFMMPFGEDTSALAETDSFQLVWAYVTSIAEGATNVTLNGVPAHGGSLTIGQSLLIEGVDEGDIIASNQNIQVYLVTGDINSRYEMRWFSLIPLAIWGNEYINPVGDSEAKVYLYNPNGIGLVVNYQTKSSSGFVVVPAAGSVAVNQVGGSAMRFFTASSDSIFIAFSISDTTGDGKSEDWGAALIPRDLLTPQALVGWGAGCTDNACGSGIQAKNLVWLTAVSDAWIHMDKNGDGVLDEPPTFVQALDVAKFDQSETFGWDMSGVYITATRTREVDSTPVDIAVAWGQDPTRLTDDSSVAPQLVALDLGTMVPPYPAILDVEISSAVIFDPDRNRLPSLGDTIEYTIQIQNVGPVDLPPGSFAIINEDLKSSQAEYVTGSTRYVDLDIDEATSTTVMDDDGRNFPLDGTGVFNDLVLLKRGGIHQIKFQVIVQGQVELSNSGIIDWPSQSRHFPYQSTIPLLYTTSQPTISPTTTPTKSPTKSPTFAPTTSPTSQPTTSPTTGSPTTSPTFAPTMRPTSQPTASPTTSPTESPTTSPTLAPTTSPTLAPTMRPTSHPTLSPTTISSTTPSSSPSSFPTYKATKGGRDPRGPSCCSTKDQDICTSYCSACIWREQGDKKKGKCGLPSSAGKKSIFAD